MKKLLALVLALALVLGLATVAFAADGDPEPHAATDKHTLTITPNNKTVAHTYQAYQVFSGVLKPGDPQADGSGQVNTIAWGTGVNSDALLAALKADSFALHDLFKDAADAADVAAVLATFGNGSDELKAVSDVIAANLSGTYAEGTAEAGKAVTIENLADGYYFVKDKTESQDIENGSYTDFMLDVVGDTEVEAKDVLPSLEKKIKEGEALVDVSNGSMGDKVEYALSSAVPDMSAYESYKFQVTDTMSKGLTFNDDVAIEIGNETLDRVYRSASGKFYATETEAAADEGTALTKGYTVESSVNPNTGVTTITIYVVNFIQYQEKTDAPITINYSATINENALVETGNANTAKLEYSNNPNESGKGENGEPNPQNPSGNTPEDKVVTFTTGLELLKVDGQNGEKKLDGAVFTLTGDGKNVVITNKHIFVEDETGEYWRLKDGSYTTDDPATEGMDTSLYESTEIKYKEITVITKEYNDTDNVSEATGATGTDGLLEFTGLGEGLYTITETQAPVGYNKLDDPIYVYVKFVPDTDSNPAEPTGTFHVYQYIGEGTPTAPEGEPAAESWKALTANGNKSELEFDLQIENNSGSTLPSTGGIGTTIFYIVGGIMALGAGVLLVTRKRVGREA